MQFRYVVLVRNGVKFDCEGGLRVVSEAVLVGATIEPMQQRLEWFQFIVQFDRGMRLCGLLRMVYERTQATMMVLQDAYLETP